MAPDGNNFSQNIANIFHRFVGVSICWEESWGKSLKFIYAFSSPDKHTYSTLTTQCYHFVRQWGKTYITFLYNLEMRKY